ncbi:hypothetical protein [Exiguobacterium sp. s162]|uniref:hypothetical protein n=1 Tax=Exiguobacterium sp. s162 TaxID=2751276 RepID=UPI001BE891B7|nr:hypothetical protein [Exiguobacterium sp. s162]
MDTQFEIERIWMDETELFYQVQLQLRSSACASNQLIYLDDASLGDLYQKIDQFNQAWGKEPITWRLVDEEEDSDDLQVNLTFTLIDRIGTIQVDIFIHDEWQFDSFDHVHMNCRMRTTMGQLDDLSAQLQRFIRRETDYVASLLPE